MKDIIQLENERLKWSLETFTEATPISSLRKLESEIAEVQRHLETNVDGRNWRELKEEYADCLMCLFDSAGRAGIHPLQIFESFEIKHIKNKNRVWKKNPDNSYSHVKD